MKFTLNTKIEGSDTLWKRCKFSIGVTTVIEAPEGIFQGRHHGINIEMLVSRHQTNVIFSIEWSFQSLDHLIVAIEAKRSLLWGTFFPSEVFCSMQ